MEHKPDELFVRNYTPKTIQINDSDELNAYTVVGNYLYCVCLGDFKKQELSNFNYVAGDTKWTSTFDYKHSYNKNNGLIFMEHYKSLTCFSTIDHSFKTLYEEDPDCWHFSYGTSDDGKIIYVLKNTELHIIGGMTEKIEFVLDSSESWLLKGVYRHDIFRLYAGLSNTAMTNSGKFIYFSVSRNNYINIYDTKTGKTITSEKIKCLGDIIYLENEQKIMILERSKFLGNLFKIYDMELNVVNYKYCDLFSSNFYSVDYISYELEVHNIDCKFINAFPLYELKNEWNNYVNSEEYDESSDHRCILHKLGNLFIFSNVTYRLIYSLDEKTFGKYLGKIPMQSHEDAEHDLQLSEDGKYLIEFGNECITSYDITCLQHREQKTIMLASSPYFTKDPLFDRNLLPLIFDFLPRD